MTISPHAIERFQERITPESKECARRFIESDIRNSTHMYQMETRELRRCEGIVYVIEHKNKKSPVVVTLYID